MPPTVLINALQAVRRRVKLLSLAYGVGVVLSAAVALVLVTILLDYALNLPNWPRVILILCAAGVLGYSIARWIVAPLLSRLSLSDVAGRIEQSFPQFNDRLRSTIDFARADVPGSSPMKQRVINEAAQLASTINLSSAVVARPAMVSAAMGLGAIVLMIALSFMVNQQFVRIAFSRLFTPFDGLPWPKSVQIEVLGDVPQRVAVGQRLELRMRLARGDKPSLRPIIYYRYDNGPLQQELMTRGEDGVYVSSIDARLADSTKANAELSVYMKAGDDTTEPKRIIVVPRMQIARVEAIVTPPAYVGPDAKPVRIDLSGGPALMGAGSKVEMLVSFNKPLDMRAGIQLDLLTDEMSPPEVDWRQVDESTAAGTWTAQQSLRFHIHGTDTDGFQNTGLEEYELIVRPDQDPIVQIEVPRRNEERTAVASVPLQGVAEDDYGIATMTLVVDRLGENKKRWEIPLIAKGSPVSEAIAWNRIDSAEHRERFRANYVWDLGKLDDANLKSGDVLEYFLQVQDNYLLNGASHEPAVSGKLRITIISQEELANRITDELRAIAQQVNDVRNTQIRTRQETESLAADTRDKNQLDNADRAAAERLANQQGTAASQAKQIAAKLDNVAQRLDENKSPNKDLRSIATEVNQQLNQTAENPMKDAAARINEARETTAAPQQRGEMLADASKQQERAADDLQRALDRMGNIGSLQQTIQSISEILSKQRELSKRTAEIGRNNLGKRPEQMSAQDREQLNQIAEAQKRLSEETEKQLAEMQKLAEQMQKSDPTSADAMKQAAQTGQQQQVAPNQAKASEQARQNQQSQAQSAQKQAEIGLEMILNQLRQAEKRKLEELSRKLEELQKQVENLIRRQAGHNLDNLTLQGPDAMGKVDVKVLDALLVKAEREKANDAAPPQLPQLTTAQEQTERNTRDLAKTAEQADGGTEPAAHLTRAASRMERAIVSLREQKLADAYSPSQVEALDALEQAKKIIDEQKAAADAEKQEQEREAIRQVYIQIRADQEKLNQETTRLDKAPRLADGNMKRDDALRLGQLPGEQGKLSDRVAKLDEDLVAVGSVVYVWANKDIASSMNLVKDDLGKKQTGVPTQAEQTRVIEQLDAMIRNLAIKPLERNFEERNSGGGGGGGGSPSARLPTEAELRLLKDLQLAINKSTKTIDAQPQKDEPKLLSLGTRQGDLRQLLDQLLQQSSQGELKLGPEPDNADQLPEEANVEDIENQEFDQDLLNDDQAAVDDKVARDMDRIGDRMARSRQRLAINHDPGRITQAIQDRIAQNLDDLIEMARQQQAQASSSSKPRPGRAKPAPQPNDAQANNQGNQPQQNAAANPANDSAIRPGGEPDAKSGTDIQQSMAEWGQITPRLRQPIIEGMSETVIEKYRNYVDDYYRSLAERSR